MDADNRSADHPPDLTPQFPLLVVAQLFQLAQRLHERKEQKLVRPEDTEWDALCERIHHVRDRNVIYRSDLAEAIAQARMLHERYERELLKSWVRSQLWK